MDEDARSGALVPVGFRVRMYRSIRDSGFVPIFPLTTLVGREESGKTSLLRALHGLDPSASEPYSLRRDWPRHQRRQPDDGQVVCTLTLRIGETKRERLVADGALDARAAGVRLGRTYGGASLVEAWSGDPHQDGDERDAAPPATDERLSAFVRAHLPRLLYAGSESRLPGAIALDELAAPRAGDEESGLAALAQLLASVGLGPDELLGAPSPPQVRAAAKRMHELLADSGVARDIGLAVRRGRIEVFLQGSRGRRTPVDGLSGAKRYRLTLELRLAAARERGEGPPTLLLDAPGRAFRGAARQRMDALLDAQVEAGVTVLYTARLPFDIDLQHSEQVLVLAPASDGPTVACPGRDARQDLAVRAALGMSGRPSFRIADVNLVVEGPTDVWIIGALDDLLRRSDERALPADVNMMSAGGSYEVAAVAAFLGRQGLCAIALVDSDEAGMRADHELLRALRGDRRMTRVEVLQLGDAAGLEVANATIEDLFPIEFYLGVVREVSGRGADAALARVRADDGARPSRPTENRVRRLATAFDAEDRRFPKARVAKALEGKLAAMASVAELPGEMAPAVRRLMRAVRAAADRHRDQPKLASECGEYEAT